jgi:predicted NBD/HSP70 family sugar kinase
LQAELPAPGVVEIGQGGAPGTLRAVAMSVANSVRPSTGEFIAGAPLLIDNDVNLAALAERHARPASEVSSFAYVYVGAGLGLALYVGDQLIRGAHGLAGEIGHLPAAVGNGQYATLAEALARQGFGGPVAPSIDVPGALETAGRAQAGNSAAITAIRELGTTIGHAIAAACAITDPELVLLGGPIGSHPALREPVRAAAARFAPARVGIAAGSAGESASLQGALHLALGHGRQQMVPGHPAAPPPGGSQ